MTTTVTSAAVPAAPQDPKNPRNRSRKNRTPGEGRIACNQVLCDQLRERGFVMYRTPGWAVERYRAHLDPGFARLLNEVKTLLDPDHLMNPGRWNL